MTPRKVKTFYPLIASEIDVSEELVEDVINFYWKEVRHQLTDPVHIAITLKGLGNFEIRKTQVQHVVDKYKKQLKRIKPTTYAKHFMLDTASKKLVLLEKLLVLYAEQEQRRKQVRQIQKDGNI